MQGHNALIGDPNFPDIDWAMGTAGSKGRKFHEATTEMFMEQLVNEATHRSGDTLDLILCDQEILVNEVTTGGRLGKSDHDIIAFKLCVDNQKEPSQ